MIQNFFSKEGGYRGVSLPNFLISDGTARHMQRLPEEIAVASRMAHLASSISAPPLPTSEDSKFVRGRYVALACDFCKRRHNRCDAGKPRCLLCTRYEVPCTFQAATNKRGRQKKKKRESSPEEEGFPASPSTASMNETIEQPAVGVAPLGMALVHFLGQQFTIYDRQVTAEVH